MKKYLNTKSKPKEWYIGQSVNYVATLNPGKITDISMPIFLVLRDLLNLGKSKEIMKILKCKKVAINNNVTKDKHSPVCIFDIIAYENKKYRFCFNNKRYYLEETESNTIFSKVLKTTTLRNSILQVNTIHGYNFLSEKSVKKGSFVSHNILTKKTEYFDFSTTNKFLSIKGKYKGLIFEKEKDNTFTYNNLPISLNTENIIGLNEII